MEDLRGKDRHFVLVGKVKHDAFILGHRLIAINWETTPLRCAI
ncbi:hypothetical protein [Streptomyces amritsarensis]